MNKKKNHGIKTPTKILWEAMRQRCYNPRHDRYPSNGGRGIVVCDRWKRFRNFLADMGERPEGAILKRIDTNGNYEPSNCLWIKPIKKIKRLKLTKEEKLQRKEVSRKKANRKARERYANDFEYRQACLSYSKQHHKAKPHLMLNRKHKREAIMINAHDGSVNAETMRSLMNERKTCPYCGLALNKSDVHIDHMDPLSKGGLHSVVNLIVCCKKCNLLKRDKAFDEWLTIVPEQRRDIIQRIYEHKQKRKINQTSLSLTI